MLVKRSRGAATALLPALVGLITMLGGLTSLAEGEHMQTPECRITVIFNNVSATERLDAAWGFACVVEGFARTILFDAGSDGNILLTNMRRLGIDPASIDGVVLSHLHGDHTGGLEQLLRRNSKVKVFLPRSFPQSFQQRLQRLGADTVTINRPVRLFERIHSTGEMGAAIKEQALLLETSKGLVVITGCAHPGVVNIVTQARQYLGGEVYLLMGGFHWMGASPAEIERRIEALRVLGVKKVAPSHCTGEAAIHRFRQVWRGDFIAGGCGAVIEIYP